MMDGSFIIIFFFFLWPPSLADTDVSRFDPVILLVDDWVYLFIIIIIITNIAEWLKKTNWQKTERTASQKKTEK